ncbi:aminotransferase class I/II-fold pyridoxal phosphate-dependent enzyme [Paenibacillus solisilvae]|uniref:Aminotransferase class I/II-fold pyridoxal phosphate-dependent enzyme n=1 Tax=Paenibacillus solisilvae TaxID=2486751 RepID=A0ABW0VSK2_9BACL
MAAHAPLYEALIQLYQSKAVSFHVPGHKYGQMLRQLPGETYSNTQFFQSIMNIDVTELAGTDDLHAPSGVIAQAQQLAARCFGAEETFFLVGGSTSGNIAMLLAVCEPGDQIIVQRNAHKSVLNGLALAGAQALFIMPQTDPFSGLEAAVELTVVEEALKRYPDAKGVFLTNPSYYGLSVDLEPYAALLHRYDKLLLVDEAHGAHYGLHPDFPTSALQAGADAVVQSTHKTLSALTMGAMLHVQGERIDRTALRYALRMIQSSSPSYPIMASLDIARAQVDTMSPSMFKDGLEAAALFKQWVREESAVFDTIESWHESELNVRMDPLRVVLKDVTGTYTGFELLERLQEYGCWAEMADSKTIVLIFGLAALEEDVERLKEALSAIALCIPLEKRKQLGAAIRLTDQVCKISEPVVLSRRPLNKSLVEIINLSESVGRKAAEAVIPYPPGIPIVYTGEIISSRTAAWIENLSKQGAKFQAAADSTMRTIAVIRNS